MVVAARSVLQQRASRLLASRHADPLTRTLRISNRVSWLRDWTSQQRRGCRPVSPNQDLTRLTAEIADSRYTDAAARPRGRASTYDGNVTAFFNDLEHACAAFIMGADAIVGCVAWLTSPIVLRALATVPEVSIIVQKEDFLRPDSRGSREDVQAGYAALHGLYRGALPQSSHLSFASADEQIEPVRCMGIENHTQRLAMPRMHHKFLVRFSRTARHAYESPFSRVHGVEPENDHAATGALQAQAVWTGSFNMTHNGGRSLENAVVISDRAVADRYADEWSWVLAMSEPLDWKSEWVEPQWRFGT